jgi:hypothetical protein
MGAQGMHNEEVFVVSMEERLNVVSKNAQITLSKEASVSGMGQNATKSVVVLMVAPINP